MATLVTIDVDRLQTLVNAITALKKTISPTEAPPEDPESFTSRNKFFEDAREMKNCPELLASAAVDNAETKA